MVAIRKSSYLQPSSFVSAIIVVLVSPGLRGVLSPDRAKRPDRGKAHDFIFQFINQFIFVRGVVSFASPPSVVFEQNTKKSYVH